MKKLSFVKVMLLSGLMVFLAASMAMADQVQLVGGGGYGPYQSGSGGEFTFQILDSNLSWVLNSYIPGKTSDLVGDPYLHNFETFCVEKNEYVNGWAKYDVALSDHSIFTNKYLTVGAAWLYHQFQIGTLTGYNYFDDPTTPVNERKTSAGLLQNTIWWLMGVGSDPGSGNSFRNLVQSQPGDPFALNNGAYPVMVMNLWAPGHVGEWDYQKQDMLVCIPEPATMFFLGSGLLGLWGFRKKLFKNKL
jgi:hypothetical protein